MIEETIEAVIFISFNRDSFLESGKLGKDNLDESSVELKENLRTKRSALRAQDVNTSNWLKRGGKEGVVTFKLIGICFLNR